MKANNLRERKCEDCGRIFTFEKTSGRMPWKCEPCRTTPKNPLDYETVRQVGRVWWRCKEGWKAVVLGRPFDYCAVICADCKEIVGWERPHDLAALMVKYERKQKVEEMVKEWEKYGKRDE